MADKNLTRRKFLKNTSAGIAGAAAISALGGTAVNCSGANTPAILGGTPVRTEPFPSWPVYDETDVQMLVDAFRSNKWCRLGAERVSQFEKKYAELMGVPYCVATNSGTDALATSLNALGVGPGDEVILAPYTFVATAQVVFQVFALAVFVDTDPETHMINADLIEERINEHTRAILPVHIAGCAADMDKIMAISRKHDIPVIEDACQAWTGEWKGRKLGSIGDLGCFSFQGSKNLNSGEGGAIIGSNQALMDMCASYTNNGRPAGETMSTLSGYPNSGSNFRMTEFQGAVLLGQIRRLEEQQKLRSENAACLDKLLEDIPGISPAKTYPGQTRHAYHLYMMNYDRNHFSGLHKKKFVAALAAEGIETISTGYGLPPLNKAQFIEKRLNSRSYQAIYSRERLDKYRKENLCPENDKLCEETGLWLYQSVLLGTKKDMEDIAEAIVKIQKNSAKLV
ncbi:MAG TPA: DegT/DnrJ/EryC1/StrS family aminotransferase [archaeon]|nr:DegT/DnrJ/EryC1/StrS family aminotransferase [archaeon]